MQEIPSYLKFKELGVCVIIPTYNNAETLATVIGGVLEYTDDVIVVDDGCTDSSATILKGFPDVKLVKHEKNKGKGIALQSGFKEAVNLGYRYAITIDSDGQHFSEDLPVFLDKIQESPDTILVGARNMEQESVPGKSSFGNKFSNFWFRFETGIDFPDTQSGYRLYPVQKLKSFTWFTNKYEFEIEVLVRAAWSGISVMPVPVKVFYAPKDTRVSHFRPFQDFSRVGVLNTVLVMITLLYIKPRNFFRLFQKKNLKNTLNKYFLKPNEPDINKVISLGFGVFMGIFPIWGFQLIVGIALCHLFKLNKGIFILSANISIPPFLPFILFLSHVTGGIILQRNTDLSFNRELSLEAIHGEMVQYYLGASVLALVAGVFTGLLAFVSLKLIRWGRSSGKPVGVN